MFFLRMAYPVPALADFGLAALTFHRMTGVTDNSLVPRGQFTAAALSWGLLLVLGMRKPVERAWILAPTALVIACIFVAIFAGFLVGVIPMTRLAFALVLCAAMILLCWTGLKQAKDLSVRHRYKPLENDGERYGAHSLQSGQL